MHMADALISPQVGGVMWGASAALTLYSARKVKESVDEGAAPLWVCWEPSSLRRR